MAICQLFIKYRIYFEIDIKYVKTAHLYKKR